MPGSRGLHSCPFVRHWIAGCQRKIGFGHSIGFLRPVLVPQGCRGRFLCSIGRCHPRDWIRDRLFSGKGFAGHLLVDPNKCHDHTDRHQSRNDQNGSPTTRHRRGHRDVPSSTTAPAARSLCDDLLPAVSGHPESYSRLNPSCCQPATICSDEVSAGFAYH